MKMWTDSSYPIILSCAKCLAPWVKREVCELGYTPIDEAENIVVVEGSMRDVLKLNLRIRTAHRVLVPLLRVRCRHIRELYNHVASIDWENLIDADGYFSVSSIVHNDTVRDTRLPSLVTKDAIADRMRDRCGTRPDSGPDYDRGAAVFLHWERDRMIIYLDTSGAPLCKRGYRKIPGSAPMQETLAAACIDALHWDRKTICADPDRLGKLMETFVYHELSALVEISGNLTLYHYRDNDKREIDFLVEDEEGRMLGLEVKAGAAVRSDDFKHLDWFRERFRPDMVPIVLNTGAEPLSFGNGRHAVPIACLFGT